MSHVKLTYFNVTARGEPIRMLLAYGGIKFEDERLEREEFTARKQSFPFGKVPVLEIDGMTLQQMSVICKYLGKKFNIAGKTEKDALDCEMLAGSIDDLRGLLRDFFFESHPEAKEQKRLNNIPQATFFLTRLEAIAAKNGGHFVNEQLTWTDFFFAGQADNLSHFVGKDLYADFPNLKDLKDKVFNLPGVKEYVATRPTTMF